MAVETKDMLASITPPPVSGPVVATPTRSGAASGSGDTARLDARSTPSPSPRLSLDHTTGLVVIEFRASAGRPEQSFPTPKELDAYRRNMATAEDAGSSTIGSDAVPPAEA